MGGRRMQQRRKVAAVTQVGERFQHVFMPGKETVES